MKGGAASIQGWIDAQDAQANEEEALRQAEEEEANEAKRLRAAVRAASFAGLCKANITSDASHSPGRDHGNTGEYDA